MRKLVITLTAMASTCYAVTRPNHVDVAVGGLFFGQFNVHYERALGELFSVQVGAGYTPASLVFTENKWRESAEWRYFSETAAARFYPQGDFQGLLLTGGANLYQNHLKDIDSYETISVPTFMPFVGAGWKFVIAGRATVTTTCASGYYLNDIKVGNTAINTQDVQPRLDISFGFQF